MCWMDSAHSRHMEYIFVWLCGSQKLNWLCMQMSHTSNVMEMNLAFSFLRAHTLETANKLISAWKLDMFSCTFLFRLRQNGQNCKAYVYVLVLGWLKSEKYCRIILYWKCLCSAAVLLYVDKWVYVCATSEQCVQSNRWRQFCATIVQVRVWIIY